MNDAHAAPGDDIAVRIREFGRFWALRMGLVRSRVFGTSYSLAETRALIEIHLRRHLSQGDLRRELNLEPSVMSRMVQKLQGQGLVTVATSPDDGRQRMLALTDRGEETAELIGQRVIADIKQAIEGLSEGDARHLADLLENAQRLIEGTEARTPLQVRGIGPGDLGWVVYRQGEVYADEHSWNRRYESGIARLVADHIVAGHAVMESAWIAEIAGQRVGSCFCTRVNDERAQIENLFIEPRYRGRGAAVRLLEESIRFARGAGYAELLLVTIADWAASERIALDLGFRPTEDAVSASLPPGSAQRSWLLDLRGPR
ncbi:helix-turn-helix domain-containing GNAT family N-acetyltransferase [Nocardioides sp. NPDC004968]|uniref:bifunctional helix-turn-helix transcriptional regulator/GNAT family N-acetyltransferase n=1 Tax=Nocardioides sp. NPDC004968 TaxID=3155894 RepID=UPI0033AE0894